jgi:hypothetical protein
MGSELVEVSAAIAVWLSAAIMVATSRYLIAGFPLSG